jgi:hypothetical protein
MGGGSTEGAELRDWIGPESPRALVEELERHLRALLRDVLCGYLEPELGAVADDILLEIPDPPVIEARDLREPPPDEDTSEIEVLAVPPEALDGVTPSVDWDEDPHSYSAPV